MNTQVVMVGAGGLLYHCLPSVATLLNGMNRKMGITVIDPDIVEEKNRARQWGVVGEMKASLAMSMLYDLMREGMAVVGEVRKVCRQDLKESNRWLVGNEPTHTIILCLPDNHLCRAQVHKALVGMGRDDTEVWGIYGGNGRNSGWAYACRYRKERVEWDWSVRNPNIIEEAIREAKKEGEPVISCGEVDENVAGQTLLGNKKTGVCIIEALDGVVHYKTGGRFFWDQDSKGTRFWNDLREAIGVGADMCEIPDLK